MCPGPRWLVQEVRLEVELGAREFRAVMGPSFNRPAWPLGGEQTEEGRAGQGREASKEQRQQPRGEMLAGLAHRGSSGGGGTCLEWNAFFFFFVFCCC